MCVFISPPETLRPNHRNYANRSIISTLRHEGKTKSRVAVAVVVIIVIIVIGIVLNLVENDS